MEILHNLMKKINSGAFELKGLQTQHTFESNHILGDANESPYYRFGWRDMGNI